MSEAEHQSQIRCEQSGPWQAEGAAIPPVVMEASSPTYGFGVSCTIRPSSAPPVFRGERWCTIPHGKALFLYIGAAVDTYPCPPEFGFDPAPGQSASTSSARMRRPCWTRSTSWR